MAEPAVAQTLVEDLLLKHRSTVLKILTRYRIPSQDAEDLIQDTLLAFLYQHDEVRDPGKWLLGTLRNRCLLYWRSRRRHQLESLEKVLDRICNEERPFEQELVEQRHDLECVSRGLSNVCRDAIQLHFLNGLSFRDTASRLGYKPSGIHKVMDRCLSALLSAMTIGQDKPKGTGSVTNAPRSV
jgi:RNA polymerase sigma factor (sigma-70 family)